MKYILVSIHDRAVDAYNRPFCVQTTGQALRMFQDEVNRQDKDNPMYAHADDYALYELGNFDEQSGKLQTLETPRQLALAKTVKGK